MIGTISIMVLGFLTAIIGVHLSSDLLTYVGLTFMCVVCAVWWFWVMFVIKEMFGKIEKATGKVTEVKEDLGVIRRILKQLINYDDK